MDFEHQIFCQFAKIALIMFGGTFKQEILSIKKVRSMKPELATESRKKYIDCRIDFPFVKYCDGKYRELY